MLKFQYSQEAMLVHNKLRPPYRTVFAIHAFAHLLASVTSPRLEARHFIKAWAGLKHINYEGICLPRACEAYYGMLAAECHGAAKEEGSLQEQSRYA